MASKKSTNLTRSTIHQPNSKQVGTTILAEQLTDTDVLEGVGAACTKPKAPATPDNNVASTSAYL